MLRWLWIRRHRLFRGVRAAQGWLGDRLARLPLPVSLKIAIADMMFLAVDTCVVHTDTYQRWRRERIGRGRLHALLGEQAAAQATPYRPMPPDGEAWKQFATQQTTRAQVDVIVPVYNGHDTTLRCLYSVLDSRIHNRTPFELIVINDASTDSALLAMLYELSGRGLFTLLENERNLGFVATVNRGMQLYPERDVLLLNADTEVQANWLDRLRAHAQQHPHTGSVTPLSNHAGICSYPAMAQNNPPMPEMDALAATANAGLSCPLPTAVGFCMYIPRDCLNEVGYFDAEAFGRGYGEENDFCLRAMRLGYTHLLAGDVYVLHAGGASFGEQKAPRERAAWKKLKRRYREYPGMVRDFITQDPALALRRRIDLARLQYMRKERNVLMISHAQGGGTQQHILERIAMLNQEERYGAFLLQPIPHQPGMLALRHHALEQTPNLHFPLHLAHEALEDCLNALGITRMEVHHLLGFPEGMQEFIRRTATRLGTGYEVTLHDYYAICPRINLTTEEDRYCGEPELAGCEACIATRSSHAGGMPVWLWREKSAAFLAGAYRITAPDTDVMRRMQRYFPTLRISVAPHERSLHGYPALTTPHAAGSALRIGIVGALSATKGARVVEALVKDAQARQLPLEYILIGYSDYPPLERLAGTLTITGRYEEATLEPLLRQHAPHLLLYPSIWPETYSYTLSHAFRYRIQPVAFDIGATASRIRAYGFGTVLPLDYAETPSALNDALLSIGAALQEHAMGIGMDPEIEKKMPDIAAG